MSPFAAILPTLARAEAVPDFEARVYALLFATYPEYEPLFVMDVDGSVRQTMLIQTVNCIKDFVGPRRIAPGQLHAARLHHAGVGIEGAEFDRFFAVLRDTVRAIHGRDWTEESDRAWAALLDALADTP